MKHKKARLFEGLPVIDSDSDLVIHVSKNDVNGSTKKDPENCAAARACKRMFNKETRVFLTRTYIKGKTHWTRYITPESTGREIVSFDRGSAFEPGEYVIKAPSPTARLGNHRGKTTHTKTGKTFVKPRHVTVSVRDWHVSGK